MSVVLAWAVAQALVLTTVAQGTDSTITEPREVVIRTAAEWRVLWAAHSPDPVPDMDFARAIVVGVFAGTRPTAGFHIEITAITVEDGRAVVQYVERGPEPGDLVAQMLTAPFHLVAVPGVDRPVEFRRAPPSR